MAIVADEEGVLSVRPEADTARLGFSRSGLPSEACFFSEIMEDGEVAGAAVDPVFRDLSAISALEGEDSLCTDVPDP